MKTLKTLALLSSVTLLLATTWAVYRTAKVLEATEVSLVSLTAVADRQLTEANKTLGVTTAGALGVLDRQLAGSRKDLAAQIAGLRHDLVGIAGTADARLAGIQADTHAAVSDLNTNLNAVLKPAGALADQLNSAAPLFLDCENNVDCVFNRFQGTSKSIERTMQTVEQVTRANGPTVGKSAQSIADSSDRIAKNVAKVTDSMTGPTPWYRKVLAGISAAAGVGRLVR